MANKRFVSLITVYTYAEDSKQAYKEAERLTALINEDFEGHDAKIEKFYLKESGEIQATEVDLSSLCN